MSARRPALRITVPLHPCPQAPTIRIDYVATGACARLLHDSLPDHVPDMIERLFAICVSAQQLASWLALCSAQGIMPEPKRLAALCHRVSLEAARETALHMLLGWPSFLNEPVQRDAALAVMKATRGNGDPAALCAVLGEAIFGCSPATWLAEFASGARSCSWLAQGRTQAARLVARSVSDSELPIHPNPAAESPLGRNQNSAFLADFAFGCLAAHRAARLLELARLALALEQGQSDVAVYEFAQSAPNAGEASVLCARGTLQHRVRLSEGRVADYRVVSPTDEAFAPFGSARAWLQTVADGTLDWPRARREQALREVLSAIDPCVEYALEFDDGVLEGAA